MALANITNNILTDTGVNVSSLTPTSTTISTTAPLQGGGDLSANRTLSITQAGASANGYLSSTDWNTFNNKQIAGDYITSLTGEATALGPGAAAVTLNNASVTGKLLTGVNITGGTVLATDTMLTAFGKLQNQINGLVGSTIYQGVWNANTNTPTLASGVGTKGYYYIVNVAGSTNLDGITDWKIGDWAIYDGTAWQKVDNTESVSSVNGFTGAVSLTTDNISEGTTNLYFTNTRAQNAITLTTTGTSGAATYSGGTLNIPQYQPVLTNPITGTGTTNTLSKFTTASTIGDSNITDTGSLITLGSNTYISSGGFGIGTTSLTNVSLRVSKDLTGSANPTGIFSDGTIQSDATGTTASFGSSPSIAAGVTSSSLIHYHTVQGTINAGATITTQIGFNAAASLIGGTTNWGFRGAIPAGTNRWNLYMDGTANNYMAGSLSIGTTTATGFRLIIGGSITGSVTSYGVYSFGTIQSDVTSAAYMYRAAPSTAAASFTVGSIFGYLSSAGSLGAGSSVTNHYGFYADALSIGTNNYGYYGAVASGTGRWNLFMIGTADNYLAGNIGIGVTQNYVSSGPILTTTLTNGGSGYVDGTYTDVASTNTSSTGAGALFTVIVSGGIVTSATLTWGGMSYRANDTVTVSNTLLGGTGSGLIITINTVDLSQLTIANPNGGDISLFRNDTSLATGENLGTIKWLSNDTSLKASGVQAKISAYAAGSSGGAYLSFFTSTGAGGALNEAVRIGNGGQVGIGGTYSLNAYSLRVEKNITGSTIGYAIASVGVSQSDVTNQSHYYITSASTAAASYTLGNLYHYRAIQGTFGAGSTVTSQSGFFVDNTLIGATNNYGFFGNIAAGTNRWNLYMNGTAANYLAGDTGIGGSQLNVSSGPILTTTLTNGGSGYVDGTYTDVLSTAITGNGTYALFTVIVSGGVVTTATLTWSGSTYRAGDTVTISNTLLGGTGSGLVITVNTVDSSQLTITSTIGADITLLRNDTTLSTNDNVGTIKWISNDSTTKASGIVAEISANGESTNGGASLRFYTRAGVVNSPLVEAMRISGTGGVGIGATVLTNQSLRVSKNITGSTSCSGIANDGVVQSDVTTTAAYIQTITSTAAASFTITSLRHFRALQGTIGAGSTVTSQYGFEVDSSLIGATNNYGFYGQIPSGTNRWNLYMSGTANNYLAGKLLIGSTTDSGEQLQVTGTAKVTGVLTLGSTITNGTYTYTLPGATGTLALTSNLGDYLPLTGGTMSGGFSITNANNTYSSPASTNVPNIYIYNSNSSSVTAHSILALRTNLGTGGNPFISWDISGVTGYSMGIDNADSDKLKIAATWNNVATSTILTFTTLGAATFASTITASNFSGSSSGTNTGDQTLASLGGVGGSGSVTQVPFWTGTSTISGDVNFIWDNTNKRLGIGLSNPQRALEIYSSTADSHLRLSGSAPSVSLGEAITGSIYQAKFGLATANGQYASGAVAGDFVIISQTGATIFSTGSTERLRVSTGGNLLLATTTDNGHKLQVNGLIYGNERMLLGTTSSSSQVEINGGSTTYGGGNGHLKITSASTGQTVLNISNSNASRSWELAVGGSTSGQGAGVFYIYDNTASASRMVISTTGATTFGSSVTATGFFESSDATIKTLITDNYQSNGIESVVAKLYTKNGKQELGYYAQDVQHILPSAVTKGADGLLNLSYREVHTAKIARLEKRVEELEYKLQKYEA